MAVKGERGTAAATVDVGKELLKSHLLDKSGHTLSPLQRGGADKAQISCRKTKLVA